MKHKLLIAAAASALMAVPSLASAQDEGWYLRGNAGYGIHNDSDIQGDLTGAVESEGNATWSVGAGYAFGNNWRLELDHAALFTDMGSLTSTDGTFAKLRTNATMLNAIYDFPGFDRWKPYVGAGLGYVQGDASVAQDDFLRGATFTRSQCNTVRTAGEPNTCSVTDTGSSLGWQLMTGLGYDISENITWDTHYRYMDAGSLDLDGVGTNTVSGATTALAADMDDVGAHSLMTGFRYKFGAATPPPPPPPPAPVADYRCWDGSMVFNAGQCPAEPMPVADVRCWDGTMVFDQASCPAQPQTYTCWDGSLVYDVAVCPPEPVGTNSGVSLVELCGEQFRQEIIYYEFDKGQSAETRNTINRILDVGQFCNVDNIRVVGHTDSSGAASYNLALSKRRAKDAMDELVRQGVNRQTIVSEGKGETELFVQTGDGVKEQLNRRTEVLITLGSIGVMN